MAQSAIVTLAPSDLINPATGLSVADTSNVYTSISGTYDVSSVPGLSVTLSGSGLFYRIDSNAGNFAASNADPATIAFDFDPLCGTVTGVQAEHGNRGNFTDVTTGTDAIGRVNKGASNPNNAGTALLWEASAPAQTGNVTFESTSSGNAGFFLRIEYDEVSKVPEPSSSALFALGGISLLARRKK